MNEEEIAIIANKIIKHHNYGKMNPIDIGMEYGYKKDEMLKFINYIKQKKKEIEPEYVFMTNELHYSDATKVYLVRIKDYSVVKFKERDSNYRTITKKNILVEYDKYELFWYDACSEQKESHHFVTYANSEIIGVYILKSGILVKTELAKTREREVFLLYWDGNVSDKFKIDEESNPMVPRESYVYENRNGIYIFYGIRFSERIRLEGIEHIDFILGKIEKLSDKIDELDELDIWAVEVLDDEIYYYIDKKRINADTGERQYVEDAKWFMFNDKKDHIAEFKNLNDYVLCEFGIVRYKKQVSKHLVDLCFSEAYNTHYNLFNDTEFYLKDAVAIPSRNCIIGVVERDRKKFIAELDFENNRYTEIFCTESL